MTVYFIQASTGHIKIGFTAKRAKARLADLQTANPGLLKLLTECPGDRADERALHVVFKELRSEGEWFRAHPHLLSLVDFVKRFQKIDGWDLSDAAADPRLRHHSRQDAMNARVGPLPSIEELLKPLCTGWESDFIQHVSDDGSRYTSAIGWADRHSGRPGWFSAQRTVDATARLLADANGDAMAMACIWTQAALFELGRDESKVNQCREIRAAASRRYHVGFHASARSALPQHVEYPRGQVLSAAEFVRLLAESRDAALDRYVVRVRHMIGACSNLNQIKRARAA